MFQPKPSQTDHNKNNEEEQDDENNDSEDVGVSLPKRRREDNESASECDAVEDCIDIDDEEEAVETEQSEVGQGNSESPNVTLKYEDLDVLSEKISEKVCQKLKYDEEKMKTEKAKIGESWIEGETMFQCRLACTNKFFFW